MLATDDVLNSVHPGMESGQRYSFSKQSSTLNVACEQLGNSTWKETRVRGAGKEERACNDLSYIFISTPETARNLKA